MRSGIIFKITFKVMIWLNPVGENLAKVRSNDVRTIFTEVYLQPYQTPMKPLIIFAIMSPVERKCSNSICLVEHQIVLTNAA